MPDFTIADILVELGLFGSLVFAGFIAIMRGNLVPGKIHKEVLSDRNYWRSVALAAVRQNDKLIIGTEVTSNILESLPISSEEGV